MNLLKLNPKFSMLIGKLPRNTNISINTNSKPNAESLSKLIKCENLQHCN